MNSRHRKENEPEIIIPAQARNSFCAKEPFKMIYTVIKSGYE